MSFSTEDILESHALDTATRDLWPFTPGSYSMIYPGRTAAATKDWIARHPEARRKHQQTYYQRNRARLLAEQRERDRGRKR